MNRKMFVVKMMQAKKLQYEAMKEILPEKLLDRFAKVENELIDFGKECFMEAMSAETHEHRQDEKEKTNARKVTIE